MIVNVEFIPQYLKLETPNKVFLHNDVGQWSANRREFLLFTLQNIPFQGRIGKRKINASITQFFHVSVSEIMMASPQIHENLLSTDR